MRGSNGSAKETLPPGKAMLPPGKVVLLNFFYPWQHFRMPCLLTARRTPPEETNRLSSRFNNLIQP